MAAMQLIVPSPMTARTGRTQEGKVSEHTLENTGPRRFLVIEQDTGTVDEQAAVLLHLAEHAPLALAVHSGSKSIHGWFYCEGKREERLRVFMRYARHPWARIGRHGPARSLCACRTARGKRQPANGLFLQPGGRK